MSQVKGPNGTIAMKARQQIVTNKGQTRTRTRQMREVTTSAHTDERKASTAQDIDIPKDMTHEKIGHWAAGQAWVAKRLGMRGRGIG